MHISKKTHEIKSIVHCFQNYIEHIQKHMQNARKRVPFLVIVWDLKTPVVSSKVVNNVLSQLSVEIMISVNCNPKWQN